MELTATEARVLGCLVERQVAMADEPAATLDELRFACNRTTARDPVVAYDDRAVEDAVMSLKSKGLARFVPSGRSDAATLYRHRADDRWRLNRYELGALAVLLLRGPQTTEQVRVALVGQATPEGAQVEAALDALAGRTPTPLAARVPGRGGDVVWVEALTDRFRHEAANGHVGGGDPSVGRGGLAPVGSVRPGGGSGGPTVSGAAGSLPAPSLADVMERLVNIERRLTGIEAALGALRSATRPETLRQP